ncbi:MAG TPA: hypothetical protein VKG25_03430, partial [Bryobacteraceae bacterium]|nr:hypothetical protein [Bryobacteraceae bacterium]
MREPRGKKKEEERGFALLLIFLLASLIAISLYMEMPRVAFETQRNREEMTVDRGEQYKRAIQVFVRANKRYPSKIEDLESFNDKRYLRHRYIDPMTGKDDWRFVHVGPSGLLTDSLVPKNNGNNPLGSKDGKNQDQSASSSTTPDPNAPPPDPNAPNGFSAATVRPSDTMILTPPGSGPPPGSDPSQPGVFPVAQIPQQPGVPQYPGQPGVQPFPGQQPGQTYPGQPAQTYPGVNPGVQPGIQPGVQPYPGQPGQPVQYPGGITSTYTEMPGTPGATDPNTGQPFTTPPPNSSSPQMNAPSGFPNTGNAANSNGNSAGSSNSAIGAINKSIFGAAPTSAFNSPQNGMGAGIAGVGLPAEFKGKGIMVIKERSKYREWEFIYDPKDDKNVVGAAAA